MLKWIGTALFMSIFMTVGVTLVIFLAVLLIASGPYLLGLALGHTLSDNQMFFGMLLSIFNGLFILILSVPIIEKIQDYLHEKGIL